jgi:hypothetical protein
VQQPCQLDIKSGGSLLHGLLGSLLLLAGGRLQCMGACLWRCHLPAACPEVNRMQQQLQLEASRLPSCATHLPDCFAEMHHIP